MFDFWTVEVQEKIMSKQNNINLWLEIPESWYSCGRSVTQKTCPNPNIVSDKLTPLHANSNFSGMSDVTQSNLDLGTFGRQVVP